ncbi:MAG: hypothetical protein IT486_02705 [Gammaproteobacteria bacterium]|nr:hypothetical protein [Gammaproteobacteria bacterium]
MNIWSVSVFGVALLAASAYGAPVINSVSGSLQEGGPVTIRGASFGSHPLDVEWLGGQDGAIESGADEQQFVATTRRPGWVEAVLPSRFDDDRSYSHDKSLIFDSSYSDGRFGLGYDTGGDIQFAYVSYYTYFDNAGVTTGQWKMYRTMPNVSVVDADTPQLVIFNKRNFGGASGIEWRPQTAGGDQEWLPNTGNQLPDAGAWHRMEIILKPSSTLGATDGWGKVWVHRPGSFIRKVYDKSGMRSYGAGDDRRWRVHMFQNYQGNGYGTDTSSGTKVWMDDIYISASQARVEICDGPQWSTCLHRDVQYPTAWRNDEVTFTFSRGGFASTEGLYVYIVDASGAVNEAGFPLVPGTAPMPPVISIGPP